MRAGKRREARLGWASLAVVGVVVWFAAGPAWSLSSGPPNSVFTDGGCSCHGASPSKNVAAYIKGLPEKYEPGTKYELLVGLTGGPEMKTGAGDNKGGFLVGATAGEFAVPAGSRLVQVSDEKIPAGSNEVPLNVVTTARHTGDGAKVRNWSVIWDSPGKAEGDVIFVLFVNSVNGNAVNTGDEWTQATFVSRGEGGFTGDPAKEAATQTAVTLGIAGVLLTALFTALSYALIARGTARMRTGNA